MSDYVAKEATLTLDIENVGFAPAYRMFDFQLVLTPVEEPSTTVVLADFDNRTWKPGETTSVSVPLDLQDASEGSYEVYLQMCDPFTGQSLRFANTTEPTDSGYYLGSFTLEQLYGE